MSALTIHDINRRSVAFVSGSPIFAAVHFAQHVFSHYVSPPLQIGLTGSGRFYTSVRCKDCLKTWIGKPCLFGMSLKRRRGSVDEQPLRRPDSLTVRFFDLLRHCGLGKASLIPIFAPLCRWLRGVGDPLQFLWSLSIILPAQGHKRSAKDTGTRRVRCIGDLIAIIPSSQGHNLSAGDSGIRRVAVPNVIIPSAQGCKLSVGDSGIKRRGAFAFLIVIIPTVQASS